MNIEHLNIEELEKVLSFLQESYPYSLIKRIEEILFAMKQQQKYERMRMILQLKNDYPSVIQKQGSEND
jgi:hypothetical protein